MKLEDSRPDVGKKALVVSNFMFTIKGGEDEWRIDEVNKLFDIFQKIRSICNSNGKGIKFFVVVYGWVIRVGKTLGPLMHYFIFYCIVKDEMKFFFNLAVLKMHKLWLT